MLKNVFIGVILVFGLIQFVTYGKEHSNPPITQEPNWDSARTKEIFMRSCNDCHSNQTIWPWYSHVAPASWLVYHDVMEARSKFNVSEVGRVGRNETQEAAAEVEESAMPLKNYLWLHPKAKLTQHEREEFLRGLKATFGEH